MSVLREHGGGTGCWLDVLRRYLVISAAANLIWETSQLPLYTIGQTGSFGEIAFAVIHCTAGDVLIAGGALVGVLLLLGTERWPMERYQLIAFVAVVIGLGLTVFIERLNTERGTWTYSELMPIVPVIRIGLSPLAQWIVIPVAAFWWARRLHPTSPNAVDTITSSHLNDAHKAGHE